MALEVRRIAATAMVVSALLLTGCSAAVISAGKSESSVVKRGLTRAEAKSALGIPVKSSAIQPAVAIQTLQSKDRRVTALTSYSDRPADPARPGAEEDGSLLIHEDVFELSGQYWSTHEAGEAASLAAFTGGLSEIFVVPRTLLATANPETTKNRLTLWSDGREEVKAYLWERFDSKGNPIPNVPQAFWDAEIHEREFVGPASRVRDALFGTIKSLGFQIPSENTPPGFVVAWRPYVEGKEGGETLNIWIKQLESGNVRIAVRTSLNATGIEHQKNWDAEVLNAIEKELESRP